MDSELISPSIGILMGLLAGTPGPLTAAKAAVDIWSGYKQTREIEALTEFVTFIGERVGDLQRLLSDSYLQTVEGQRFANKIVAAAVDAKLGEKRGVFANAFINGIRRQSRSELNDLDQLRFVDLIISLSAASLVELALIHEHCEPLFLAASDPDMATIDIGDYRDSARPEFKGESGGAAHYHEATLRELKSAGLFARKSYRRMPDGSAIVASHVQGEDKFYTTYTRAFACFVSASDKFEKDGRPLPEVV